MCNILNDLSILTTIPLTSLERLSNLSTACICHTVEDSIRDNEDVSIIDIGIGKLYIKLENNSILYKFMPSTEFESSIKQTVLSKKSPLDLLVESTLKDKITKTYKDFI